MSETLNDVETVSTDTGAEGQEVTEPADENIDNTDETNAKEGEEGEKEQDTATPVQSDDDNAMYAAARRKAEQEKELAIKEAVEKTKKEVSEQLNQKIAASNLFNPYTNKPVNSLEEFDSWQAAYSKERLKTKMDEVGVDENTLNELASLHPAVREAQQLKKQLEQHEKEVNEQRYRGIVEASLKHIQEYDPAIKSIKDLAESEHGAEIEEMIKRGMRIDEAWKLANIDLIAERKAKAAKLETAKNLSSKEHLNKSNQHGQNEITVPADMVAEFRRFNPKATIEEIQQFYAKDSKQFKKKKG